MSNMRRWLRVLHRDIGYIAVGLTIIYSISGIAVNHIQEWNPNYSITKDTVKITPVPDSLGGKKETVAKILNELGETGELKNSFRPDPETLEIFVEGNTITVNLKEGIAVQEKVKSRPIIRETNFLHLNTPKKVWTYVADVFAVALIFLAVSGLFLIKGKNGLKWRGAVLMLLGILIPLLFLYLYYW